MQRDSQDDFDHANLPKQHRISRLVFIELELIIKEKKFAKFRGSREGISIS